MRCEVLDIRTVTQEDARLWYEQADAEKQAQLSQLRSADAYLSVLCADHLARTMLAPLCALPPQALRFSREKGGKPYLKGFSVQFSVSHSGNFAACAVHDAPIGLDIEQLREVRPAMLKRVCSAQELCFVQRDGAPDSVRFLQVWTAKEAYLKCTGEGITGDLRQLETANADGLLSVIRGCALHNKKTEDYVLSYVYEMG